MDLKQNKLTKDEWEALEVPVKSEELTIAASKGINHCRVKRKP